MSTTTLEQLQAQLEEKIAKLDEERLAAAKRNQEERERMQLEAEMERQERLAQYEAKLQERERLQKAKEEEEEARRQAEQQERIRNEQKQNELDETLRLQKEKLEWLEKAISDAEFAEEQHRKNQENSRVVATETMPTEEVSAEYPQTSADGGAAADGTDGSTPDSPLMSTHLKNILRQATRSY